MHVIHEHVTVYAVPPSRNRSRQQHAKHEELKSRRSAPPVLQYVVENTGLRAVTFRVDFAGSRNVIVADTEAEVITADGSGDGLAFEYTVFPFERRVMLTLAKRTPKERAMIRVTYELLAAFEPCIDEISRALEQYADDLRELAIASDTAYSFTRQHSPFEGSTSRDHLDVADLCADVNQFFSLHRDVWVDPTFPKSSESDAIVGPETSSTDSEQRFPASGKAIPFSMCAWRSLHSLSLDKSLWCVFRAPAAPAEAMQFIRQQVAPGVHGELAPAIASVVSGLPGQHSLTCALAAIAMGIGRWKHSWFPLVADSLTGPESLDYIAKNITALPVRLCEGGVRWTSVVVDLFMPVFPLGDGLLAPRSVQGELWPALLFKALVKLRGSCEAVTHSSTIDNLRELLGVPCVRLHDPERSCQSSSERSLQRKLERIFVRARQTRNLQPSDQPILIAEFSVSSVPEGAGFSVLDYECTTSEKSARVLLRDIDGMLGQALGKIELSDAHETKNTAETESLDVLAVPWHDFISLQPRVWTFLPSVCHAHRVRDRFLRRDVNEEERDGPRAIVVAISLASVSTVVIAGHLDVPGSTASTICRRHSHAPTRLEVRIRSANLVAEPMATVQSASSDVCTIMKLDSHQERVSVQVVRTLSPGEYIVTIRVVDCDVASDIDEAIECSCPLGDEQETKLSLNTAETNLAQLFECLDRELRGFLTASDLSALLSQYGSGIAGSQKEIAAIEEQFIARFGSFVGRLELEDGVDDEPWEDNRAKPKRALRLNDLRDVYRLLALDHGQIEGANGGQDRERQYREMVWHDLTSLLGKDEASSPEQSHRAEIRVRDIAELVCCVSSDSPLVDCVPLSGSVFSELWSA